MIRVPIKTNYMLNFKNFSTKESILDLKLFLDRAYQDLKLCPKKKSPIYLINLNYFTTLGINELLYPYTVMSDLFFISKTMFV